jgi:hypothetical protein
MTREEVMDMAYESGVIGGYEGEPDLLERFAKLVYEKAWADTALAATHTVIDAAILKEREACAKLAEQTVCDTHLPTGVKIYGTRVAKAIRARSNNS